MRATFVYMIITVALCSCRQTQSSDSNVLLLDSAASCPYITKDQENNFVVSYVSHTSDSTSILRYCQVENDGSFSDPAVIEVSTNVFPHPENLPKIIFNRDGSVLCAWGTAGNDPRNKYAGKIHYSQSFDKGRSWQKARRLVLDTTSYDQRYFDLAHREDGDVVIIWLDNRESRTQEGSSIYISRTAGRRGFTGERCINESICPCCRTELFTDSKGNIHVCFRDIINDTIRDMVHMVSADNGKTFSEPNRISVDNWVISGCPHTGPAMTETAGNLHFSWFTGEEPAGVYFCSSKDLGRSFTSRDSVSRHSSAKHPQIASISGNRSAIVWDETVKSGETFNSRIGLQIRDENGKILSTEFITADTVRSEYPVIAANGNRLLIAFTQFHEGRSQVAYRLLTR